MNKILLTLSLIGLGLVSNAQKSEKFFDVALAAKNSIIAPSLSFEKNYGLGNKKKFSIGWGVRANAVFGGAGNYITAPALLTSGKRSLAALFTEYKNDKLDTLDLKKTGIIAFNSKIVLQYRFKKSDVGFNIDVFGVTFGGNQSGIFRASESKSLNKTTQTVKPAPFNLLLISDSDRGSLNSELYYRYWIKKNAALRVGLSFQFVEYKANKILTYENDRYRIKLLMPFIAYSFNPFK